MQTERNILIAFLLNLGFSVFEFFGGVFTGSVAILSDAVHDLGDALGIGVSWFLERKSKRPSDAVYTYGYARFRCWAVSLPAAFYCWGRWGLSSAPSGGCCTPSPSATTG